MESHPYEKTRGDGVPSSITLNGEAESAACHAETTEGEAELCRHIDARGHRCRMLVMTPEQTLCPHHAQRENGRISEAAEELLASGTDFGDAAAVNRFLGALVRQVTLKRIPRRDAVTLAYICQLLLNSLGAINREESLRLEEARVRELAAAKRPPRIIWDIPGPPYEPPDPLEAALAKRQSNEEIRRGLK